MPKLENFNVIGIGRDVSEARITPKRKLEITTHELSSLTNGKLFVAIKDDDPNVPNALALRVSGMGVNIRNHEKWVQTNSAQPPEYEDEFAVIPFDFPMRFVDGVQKPQTYSIVFEAGIIEKEKFIKYGESVEMFLVITSDDLPDTVYDQQIDGD
jgi:hypothetical protein